MTVTNTLLAGLAGNSNTSSATAKPNSQLDQTAFLKLMTTQLQTQDPFNPVDNTQMVAQMAQFSSVAGIAEMNASLKTLTDNLTGNRVSDAASWIGRSALVASDVATPLADGSYAGEVTLPNNADNVQINLVDANGALVHSETLGAQAAGTLAFQWDGKDAAGAVTATGPLKVVVSATGTDGTITTSTNTWASINAVQSPAGGSSAQLVTALGLISPTDALRLG